MTLIPARITVDGSGDTDEVGILIDGAIRPGTGPEQKLISRIDGRVLAVVRSAGPTDVRTAYQVAAEAAPAWGATGPAARAEVLHRAAELFRERATELAPIISADMGKPASEATVEVAKGAAVLDYYAELGYRRLGTTYRTDFDEDIFTIVEPLGVVALITPWNFPFTPEPLRGPLTGPAVGRVSTGHVGGMGGRPCSGGATSPVSVAHAGFEPAVFALRGRCPGPLDECASVGF